VSTCRSRRRCRVGGGPCLRNLARFLLRFNGLGVAREALQNRFLAGGAFQRPKEFESETKFSTPRSLGSDQGVPSAPRRVSQLNWDETTKPIIESSRLRGCRSQTLNSRSRQQGNGQKYQFRLTHRKCGSISFCCGCVILWMPQNVGAVVVGCGRHPQKIQIHRRGSL
jgi:hypothetical protein